MKKNLIFFWKLVHSVEISGFFWSLRENNFGESRSAKTAIFATLGALNYQYGRFQP